MKSYSICLLFTGSVLFLTTCSASDKAEPVKTETTASGLKIDYMFIPEAEACDKKSKVGDMLTMHYTGVLQKEGTKFDSR